MTTFGFVSQDRSMSYGGMLGGAGQARIGAPHEAFTEHGIEARCGVAIFHDRVGIGVLPIELCSASVSAEERADAAWFPDVLVMQRYMHDNMPQAIRSARALGQIVVNDIDDLFDAVPPSNSAFKATHPFVNPTVNVQHYRATLASSTAVTVSTPYLADRLRHYVRNPILVIRNTIDLRRYTPHEHDEPPRLGWTGVLSHRASDLEQLRGVTRDRLGHGYAERFVHCGARVADPMASKALGLDESQVEEYGMAPTDKYPHLLEAIDVGVAPLSGHPFNMAKSAIKGMEYAASGIPFIASATPEYQWLYATHGIGRLASKPRDWTRHMVALADPDVRHAEAREQREHLRPLDISQRWTDWLAAYESLA